MKKIIFGILGLLSIAAASAYFFLFHLSPGPYYAKRDDLAVTQSSELVYIQLNDVVLAVPEHYFANVENALPGEHDSITIRLQYPDLTPVGLHKNCLPKCYENKQSLSRVSSDEELRLDTLKSIFTAFSKNARANGFEVAIKPSNSGVLPSVRPVIELPEQGLVATFSDLDSYNVAGSYMDVDQHLIKKQELRLNSEELNEIRNTLASFIVKDSDQMEADHELVSKISNNPSKEVLLAGLKHRNVAVRILAIRSLQDNAQDAELATALENIIETDPVFYVRSLACRWHVRANGDTPLTANLCVYYPSEKNKS